MREAELRNLRTPFRESLNICVPGHWQAPDSVKGRMYKVLKEVIEEKQTGSEGKSQDARLTLCHRGQLGLQHKIFGVLRDCACLPR